MAFLRRKYFAVSGCTFQLHFVCCEWANPRRFQKEMRKFSESKLANQFRIRKSDYESDLSRNEMGKTFEKSVQ